MADENKKPEFSLKKMTEQQLVESGAFIRELDERVHIEKLNEKVDTLVGALDRLAAKLERVEEKAETRHTNLTDKVAANTNEIERTVTQLQLSVSRHDAQISVLMDLKESNWTAKFLTIIENKQVRAALLLGGGWIATQLGPEVLKTLLKLFQ